MFTERGGSGEVYSAVNSIERNKSDLHILFNCRFITFPRPEGYLYLHKDQRYEMNQQSQGMHRSDKNSRSSFQISW